MRTDKIRVGYYVKVKAQKGAEKKGLITSRLTSHDFEIYLVEEKKIETFHARKFVEIGKECIPNF